MTSFVDKDFYSQSFGGTVVPQSAFLRVSLKATAYIKTITKGKADPASTETGEAVKLATCGVMDVIYRAETGAGSLAQSEGLGGDVTVSYGERDVEKLKYAAAREWLQDTDFLFMGV